MASPKLLLADDSVTIQRVIELTFAEEDVQVVTAGDGQEAIARLQADRPDIILADIGMPERDGYEVAAFVKGDPQLAHIPVLLLTGAFEPIDEARAKAIGCDGVLVKPFEPQMVISRVRELLARGRRPSTAPPAAARPELVEPVRIEPQVARNNTEPAAEPARQSGDALEEYFDRLDAALANLGAGTPDAEVLAPIVEPVPDGRVASRRPVFEAGPQAEPSPALIRVPDFSSSQSVVSSGDPVNEATSGPLLHEAFAALLAAEQGRPLESQGYRLDAPAQAAPQLPEEAIEDIVRRVLARMGTDDMRRAVLDAADRLVREEIDRIKSRA